MARNTSPKTPDKPEDKHYMTPTGHAVLERELNHLLYTERPKIVEIVAWASGNGDRSENGDYIYNKKRLREIDRRVRYLTKRLEKTIIVDPVKQQHLDRIFFGAQVTYAREDDSEVTIRLVGEDEANFAVGKINWLSPVGRALMKKQVGDTVIVRTDEKTEKIEILSISYPIENTP
ncbi:MAG: transcription elongation factor GreB [Alphaproteobacteria bacterium]|nr:transcription elongation factor GreB [Alphaproteobacteria bacterium]